jgi:MFS-type transporter involved in bile tolerance (Atg22 family)
MIKRNKLEDKIPELPTLIFNTIIFIISTLIMIFAINTHDYISGIISLILTTITFKVKFKNNH